MSEEDPKAPQRPSVDDLPEIDPATYELGDEVAHGGLGTIVSARDTRLDRTVALKKLALQHGHARARFAREVLITARLQHPNIIPLHEAGRFPDGQPFYAMKLVEGQSLAEAIDEAPDLPARLRLLSHVTDVAEAMAYAHSQGIIHRDLKPANVLVGPFGETMVIDWGLAKDLCDPDAPDDADVLDPAARLRQSGGFDTSDGAVLGTPAYMPPEQAGGGSVDARADVYALGAILYQLLASVRPYAHRPPRKVLPAVVEGPPQPLEELVPDAPRDLIAIAEKAMAREPADRYPTAREMAAELVRFSTGGLVGAHAYSTWELLTRFARHARGVLITTAIALTVLVVLGVLSIQRISSERDRAEESAAEARTSQQAEARARAETERRAQELILESARALLNSDPTLAVARLKQLDPMREGAATIAAAAAARGVARAILRGHEDVVWAVGVVGDRTVSVASDGVVLWPEGASDGASLAGHADRVAALAVAPDRNRFATGSYDRTIRIWAADGTPQATLSGHRDRVKDVVFAGSDHVASLDVSGEARLWDLPAGTSRVLEGSGVRDGALAASATRVAVASEPNAIHLWELASTSRTDLTGHAREVTALAFSPAGDALVSADAGGEVRRWQLGARPRGRRLGAHPGPVRALAVSSGGTIASGDMDGGITTWNAQGRLRRLPRHDGRITSLTFAPGGELLVSTSWDRTARIWRHRTGDYRALLGHADVVSDATIDSSGGRVVTASWDKTARVWPLEPPVPTTLGSHPGGVRSVAVSSDGRLAASAGRDHDVGLWRTDGSGGQHLSGHRDIVYRVVFSHDVTHLASSSDDQTVRLWRIGGDGARQPRVLTGHGSDVEELAFSHDGALLASGSKDDTARLWPVPGGAGRIATRHGGDVTDVAFSPDGRWLATAGRDGVIRLVDPNDPAARARELRGHEGEVWSLAFTADSRELLSTGTDETVRSWRLDTATSRRFDRAVPGARHVRVAGDVVAVAGRSQTLWICDRPTHACRAETGHDGAIEDIALSPGGELLVSASADATVRVWDTATGEHQTYRGHGATVFDVDLTHENIYSASGDGRVIRWPWPRVRQAEEVRAWLEQLTRVTAGSP